MVTGCDQVVHDGAWSMTFYGATSGFAFVMRTIELFQPPGSVMGSDARSIVARLFDAPLPPREILNPDDIQIVPIPHLAAGLVDCVFARCHPLLQFLEQSDFRDMMNHIYEDIAQHGTSDERSMSLFHLVLALAYLFSTEYHQNQGCKLALREA